jgi:MraZ protein
LLDIPAERDEGGGLISGSRSPRRFHFKAPYTGQGTKGRDRSVARRFRGEGDHKVDNKGRVSIPASFRRVIQEGDPDWKEGLAPRLILVYGDHRRAYIEGFTITAMDEVDEKIARLPRGAPQRKALERLYSAQAMETEVDPTGRIVLPAKLRDKLGLDAMARFVASGDTFEIWHPDTYDSMAATEIDDALDPDVDPSAYLDGDLD